MKTTAHLVEGSCGIAPRSSCSLATRGRQNKTPPEARGLIQRGVDGYTVSGEEQTINGVVSVDRSASSRPSRA